MSSIGGKNALPLMAPYCASKFALEGFSDSLRMELQPWGIHVSVIEPGSIKTPLWDKGLDQADELLQRLPAAANELYGEAVIKAKVAADREAKRGSSPEKVAIAVEHALTATRPKTRYLVGLDARAVSLVKKLPDRAVDKLIRQQIGL